jgi:hypothetical protein
MAFASAVKLGAIKDLNKLLGDRFGHCAVAKHIQCNDPAKGRAWIGFKGFLISFKASCAGSYATGISVFDNDAGCSSRVGRKALHTFPCRIRVGNVVIGKLFALKLVVIGEGASNAGCITIKRSRLVGVLTVAHLLHFSKCQVQSLWVGRAAGMT